MKIRYTYKAAKDLENLPRSVQERIVQKMRHYASQENPLQFAEKLTEPRDGEFRFRVGDYRIIFDVAKNEIFVLAIRKRDKAYQ